jgi:hypothetical protein
MRARMIGLAVVTFGMNALYPGDRRFGALFLGFGIGYFLMRKYFPFSASVEVPKKFLEKLPRICSGLILRGIRFFLGSAALVLIYYGLNVLLGEDSVLLGKIPPLGAGYYEMGRFLHYCIAGLWVSAGAPWVFLRLGLAAPFSESRAAA